MNSEDAKELLVKWKIISFKEFLCRSHEADIIIYDPLFDHASDIIVDKVSSSLENFIMNYAVELEVETDPLILIHLSSSKRLEVTESILKEL